MSWCMLGLCNYIASCLGYVICRKIREAAKYMHRRLKFGLKCKMWMWASKASNSQACCMTVTQRANICKVWKWMYVWISNTQWILKYLSYTRAWFSCFETKKIVKMRCIHSLNSTNVRAMRCFEFMYVPWCLFLTQVYGTSAWCQFNDAYIFTDVLQLASCEYS